MRGGDKTALGLWGEAQAAVFLEGKGYTILQRRYHCREGEIDLVAFHAPYTCFVEVKLRKNRRMGEAREFVTLAKQRKLRAAALAYLAEHQDCQTVRFDVIEVYAPYGQQTRFPEIYHWEDAF